MNLHILTIVLDGMPFLPMQMATFNRLKVPFVWHIVHGAAANTGSTKWCQRQEPRLSTDGSSEFINSLRGHPRVKVYQKQWWAGGKDEMACAPLAEIRESCVLAEIDIDEIWLPEQLELIRTMLDPATGVNHEMVFKCRYFLGPNIVTVGDNCYGNKSGGREWVRAWRFEPGQKFISHEPPVLSGHSRDGVIPREMTAAAGLVFDHWSWYFPAQISFKEKFYGYKDALAHWTRLQNNRVWPVKLKDFFHWADDKAEADLLHK
jgi:hypothetical protein